MREPVDGFEHSEQIADEFRSEAGGKYQAGYLEHGGRLWRKSNLVGKAIEEAHDLVIYLHSLRAQLHQARKRLGVALATDDWGEVSRAYSLLAIGNADGVPEEDR